MAWKLGRILIEAATGEVDSDSFRLAGPDLPANVVFDTLGTDESVDIEVLLPDGTYAQAKDQDDNDLTISGANGNNLYIQVPGVFRVHKDVTASAVEVALCTASQPGYDDGEPQRATRE